MTFVATENQKISRISVLEKKDTWVLLSNKRKQTNLYSPHEW